MIRVLILDDDPLFVKSLANSLKQEKTTQFIVEGVINAEDARAAVTKAPQPFDVLLIDNRLGPGADGITVMQELRQLSPESEAIVFTGLAEPEVGLRAYRNGAFRYLAKPFERQELVWILQQLMEWRKTVYERRWFRVLAEISEQLEQSHSYDDVARLIVDGGQKLGFERARLWAFSEDGATMTGIAEAGNPGLDNFSQMTAPVAASPYAQRSLQKREPIFFIGRELGPTYFETQLKDGRHQSPIGEWAAIPLWSGDRCIGKLALDNAENPQTLRPSQRRLLRLFGRIVSAALERTKLYERESRQRKEEEAHRRRLAILHRASEEIMKLAIEKEAVEQEEWLWHTALTLATANYGLRFDRAVLFLSDRDGMKLQGQMGIGHFDRELAEKDWEGDVAAALDFDGYLARLRGGELQPTPVEEFVRGWTLDLSTAPDSAFQHVLHDSRRAIVDRDSATGQIPAAFIEKFGVTDYAILPLRTTTDALGIVVVDNVFDHKALDDFSLDYLETFLAQAALLYENRQQAQFRDNLIRLNNEIAPRAWARPLKETLTQICEIACTVTGADFAIIYPLKPGGEPYEYEAAEIGHAGLLDTETLAKKAEIQTKRKLRQKGITIHVLRAGRLVIPDVSKHPQRFDGRQLARHPFVRREKVKAFIGRAIVNLQSGEPLGVLYLEYRAPQKIGERQLSTAQSIANLTAVAIDNARQGEQKTAAQLETLNRENELRLLRDVLEETVGEQADEEWVIRTVLQKCQQMLGKPDVRHHLLLRVWQPGKSQAEEPTEIFVYYSIGDDGALRSRSVAKKDHQGPHGYVLQTGETKITNNVSTADCYESGGEDTCSELDVPILLSSRAIGLFNIESPHFAGFSQAEASALERLASVTALAIDNMRRQKHLYEILGAAKAVTAPLDLKETLDAICDSIRKVVPDLSTLTIWYKDPESQRIQLGPYFGIRHTEALVTDEPTEGNVVWKVMVGVEPIYEPDAQRDGSPLHGPFVRLEKIRSCAAFPLSTDGEVVGAMFFSYREPHQFNTEEKALFPIMAEIVASSIRDALALETSQQARKRLHVALDITKAVGTTVDLEQTLTRVVRKLVEWFPHATPCITRYDDETGKLIFQNGSLEFYTVDNPDYSGMTRIGINEQSAATRVARKALHSRQLESENIPDVSIDDDYRSLRTATKSQLNVSLMGHDNNLLGVLIMENTKTDAFDDEDVQLMRSIARQVSIAFERAQQTAELEFKNTLAAATAWAADMAHDINREIYFIRNRADWLADEKSLPEKGRQYLKEIDESAERLAGALPLTGAISPINLNRWLPQRIDEIVRDRGGVVKVEYHHCAHDLIIYTNPADLQRCLRHLVRNAIQAMNNVGRLIVRTRQINDQWVEIEIEDNGPGVPDRLRDKLFQQKFSADGEEGGMGLLFVRAAVENMHGKVRCASYVPEEGARFVIRLPIGSEESTQL